MKNMKTRKQTTVRGILAILAVISLKIAQVTVFDTDGGGGMSSTHKLPSTARHQRKRVKKEASIVRRNKMNLLSCIVLAVVISVLCTSCYTVIVRNDDLQQDITVKIGRVSYAKIPPGAIEQIEVIIYNNTNESLFIDWVKSSIQDDLGSHGVLPNRSVTQLVFLQMPPVLVPRDGFIRNWLYRMDYPNKEYNARKLVLTLCYRFGSIDSKDEEKFTRFILQSTKKDLDKQ
jgi:hypothetical protein